MHSCWIIWLEYVCFCKKLLNNLLKHYTILPLEMNESSCCSTSLPTVSIARFKKESYFHWCILATHCSIHNFLMTDDIKHVFIGSLATCISSLVSCVWRFFHYLINFSESINLPLLVIVALVCFYYWPNHTILRDIQEYQTLNWNEWVEGTYL